MTNRARTILVAAALLGAAQLAGAHRASAQVAADTTRPRRSAAGEVDLGSVREVDLRTSRPARFFPPPPPPPARVAWTDSLREPESVRHDSAQDVYFVSNITGPSLQKGNDGFISRVRPDGTRDATRWVAGGAKGVTLHAPKGMAIVGDTLWVTDIDAVRGFHRVSGAPVATVELAAQGATFLNDIAVGPDGALYVTDTQIAYDARGNATHPRADRVYRIGPDRAPSIALESDRLSRPNGIEWDRANGRFVIVPFGGDTLFAWRPGTTALEPIATGPGQFDGVAITRDGRLFVSSQATQSIYELQDGELVKRFVGLPGVADISLDERQMRLLVPLTGANRVEVHRVP